MKNIFDSLSFELSKKTTLTYSTSFTLGVKTLHSSMQNDIYAIYGFVRLADEIVDSFHKYNKNELLKKFKNDTYQSIKEGISLNPILNSFQISVNKYQIDLQFIEQFFISMEMDLNPKLYDEKMYKDYINGSAEVVGLMCLQVFVGGNKNDFEALKPYAIKLGSAFQKVNFLRDLKNDFQYLGRVYFPGIDIQQMSIKQKIAIEHDIENEFKDALIGIKLLPKNSKLGVYVAYTYYTSLLDKIKKKSVSNLLQDRIRLSNGFKFYLLIKSYLFFKLKLI